MRAETADAYHVRLERVFLVEEFHMRQGPAAARFFVLGSFIQNSSSQRVFSHESDDQDRVSGIVDAVAQMVQDAARFTHTRCRQYDVRPFTSVQRHRLLH